MAAQGQAIIFSAGRFAGNQLGAMQAQIFAGVERANLQRPLKEAIKKAIYDAVQQQQGANVDARKNARARFVKFIAITAAVVGGVALASAASPAGAGAGAASAGAASPAAAGAGIAGTTVTTGSVVADAAITKAAKSQLEKLKQKFTQPSGETQPAQGDQQIQTATPTAKGIGITVMGVILAALLF